MSRALTTALAALVLLLASVAPASAGELDATEPVATTPAKPQVVPGEVVVKWRDPASGDKTAAAHGLRVQSELAESDPASPEVVSTQGRPVDEVLAELRADPAVAYAEPNYVVHLAASDVTTAAVAVNDPKTGPQYSLDRMRVRDAWSLSTGSTRTVAVLDTGIDKGHPDFAGRIVAGYDFVNNDSNAADDNGHGTWVSGIIAANANDGFGIAGISWRDRIMPVKIMNAAGTGDTSDLTAGIIWAADRGAKVINMSVGGFPYSTYVHDAVRYAWSKGAVLVGAAGNNAVEGPFFPASYPEVVSVSATQVDDEFSFWSNYGADVDVSAPGSSILTTNCAVCKPIEQDLSGDNRFTYISGTSFAAPNVSGVVALIMARYPTMTNAQVVDRLKTTVDDLGYRGWDNRYGLGRVNALRAVGGSAAPVTHGGGDGAEGNNTLAAARALAFGTVRPNIYPAGDVDVFAVDAPRAGRIDISVGAVLDPRSWPWNRSSQPMDPVLNVYRADGTHVIKVDAADPGATDRASVQMSGPGRLLIRINNYTPNGSRTAYPLTTAFVDNVAPAARIESPLPNATRVSFDGAAVSVSFSEPVANVAASTFQLRDGTALVPATVTYDSAARRAVLRPTATLRGERTYRATLGTGIRDAVGNALAATSWSFTTGKAAPRLAGADRYATAAVVSAARYPAGVPVVYVATGAAFPDALVAAPAARIGGGPLLLVGPTHVPSATAAELARLRPGRIVVLGSSGAVSEGVLSALRGYTAGTVTRQAGADRYATAAVLSQTTFPGGADLVFVATGADYPDALAAGAEAAAAGAPVLLVKRGEIPPATRAELSRLGPSRIVVMGSAGVVSDAVVGALRGYAPTVERVAGGDRYETAVALSRASHGANSVPTVYIATGSAFPDGLATGPVAGRQGSPLLLVPRTGLPAVVAEELRRLDPSTVVVIGGAGAVSNELVAQVRAIWD